MPAFSSCPLCIHKTRFIGKISFTVSVLVMTPNSSVLVLIFDSAFQQMNEKKAEQEWNGKFLNKINTMETDDLRMKQWSKTGSLCRHKTNGVDSSRNLFRFRFIASSLRRHCCCCCWWQSLGVKWTLASLFRFLFSRNISRKQKLPESSKWQVEQTWKWKLEQRQQTFV